MNRTKLIQLIHIAKQQLNLDDETYRQKLTAVTNGKTSCSKMTELELKAVYDSFIVNGFQHVSKLKPTRKYRTNEINKIRAIWVTMYREGFINDGSENALNRFVQRQTLTSNGGLGVADIAWLNHRQAVIVLESLKKWRYRVMVKNLRCAVRKGEVCKE